MVIGSMLLIGTVLSVFVVFPNLKSSAGSIGQSMHAIEDKGKTLTVEECVAEVVAWHDRCAADNMPMMCLQETPKATAHCLAAVDRTEGCAPYLADNKDAHWAFKACAELGIDKASAKPRRKACTAAWRALDQFCKTGQKGVFWGVK